MSFHGLSDSALDVQTHRVVENTDIFFPDIDAEEFVEKYRMPRDYAAALIADHLELAMLYVNEQLQSFRDKAEKNGFYTLDEAAKAEPTSDQKRYLLLYKRAIFCYAKSILLKQLATTGQKSVNSEMSNAETRDELLEFTQNAIRDFLRNQRVHVAIL